MGSKKIIIFDGYCNLCSGTVKIVKKFDPSHKFITIASQSKEGQELMKKYLLQFADQDTIFLVDEKQIYFKSNAVLKIIKELKYPVKLLLVLKIFPSSFLDCLYDLVAKYRHRIFGSSVSCDLNLDTNKEI
ncbi:MAG: DUF393 domain-containing protein [Bacteroidales bacterium]|nr:DUF393 domain-containing protein [Bacteroidales bacterium]MCF8404225.1 DUF393 domain-containing protein [Bacteroidales bacterium]